MSADKDHPQIAVADRARRHFEGLLPRLARSPDLYTSPDPKVFYGVLLGWC